MGLNYSCYILLLLVINVFCNCVQQIKYLVAAAIAFKGLGSLLFIFGSSLGAYLLVRTVICFENLNSVFYTQKSFKTICFLHAASASGSCYSYTV